MDFEIVQQPEFRVIGVRHVGPYDQIRPAFERLGTIAGKAGLFGRDGVRMLGVYHDNPQRTAPQQLRSDAALTLPDGEAVPYGLDERRVGGGKFLKIVHRGSYERLAESWQAAMEAANADGRRMRPAASYELYVNAPGQVAEEDLQTEIYVPIE